MADEDEEAPRFVVETRERPYPHFVIVDRLNTDEGFTPKSIAVVQVRTYARLICDALNAHAARKAGTHV